MRRELQGAAASRLRHEGQLHRGSGRVLWRRPEVSNAAKSAGLAEPERFHAYLSTADVDAKDRFQNVVASFPYVLVTGTKVADNFAALIEAGPLGEGSWSQSTERRSTNNTWRRTQHRAASASAPTSTAKAGPAQSPRTRAASGSAVYRWARRMPWHGRPSRRGPVSSILALPQERISPLLPRDLVLLLAVIPARGSRRGAGDLEDSSATSSGTGTAQSVLRVEIAGRSRAAPS
jgi:hypothetical protein